MHTVVLIGLQSSVHYQVHKHTPQALQRPLLTTTVACCSLRVGEGVSVSPELHELARGLLRHTSTGKHGSSTKWMHFRAWDLTRPVVHS